MRTPTHATPATIRGSTASDLDVDDAADEEETNTHHQPAEAEDEVAGRLTEQLGRLLEHGRHERGRDDRQENDQRDRQEADHVARHALLRGERPDLTLDPDTLANGVRDGVEDLGEVAADLVLNCD